MHIFAGIVDL